LKNAYLESALRWRCSFRYHKRRLLRGMKSDTANASSCQPWRNTKVGGLVLQSSSGGAGGGVASREVGEPRCIPPVLLPPPPFPDEDEESHAKSDCVAHSSSCWRHTTHRKHTLRLRRNCTVQTKQIFNPSDIIPRDSMQGGREQPQQ
jgi:hypothetical protein